MRTICILSCFLAVTACDRGRNDDSSGAGGNPGGGDFNVAGDSPAPVGDTVGADTDVGQGDAAGGDTDINTGDLGGPTCTGVDCTFLDDDCNVGVCNPLNGTCEPDPLPGTTPCGNAAAGNCDLDDFCDGAGACTDETVTDGSTCDDCAAGAGNCGGCGGGVCLNRCGNNQIDAGFNEDCDGTADAACPGRCAANCTCILRNCSDVLRFDAGAVDGVHPVTFDDGATTTDVYCDMTTDGGGWTMLGTVAGQDADSWNVDGVAWGDASTFGTAQAPYDDYKSAAWNELNVSLSTIMLQRRYSGAVEAQVDVARECLGGAAVFSELFTTFDASLACAPSAVTVITSSATGLANATYEEGAGNLGLGGAGTNGFCWQGEDNAGADSFQGRLVWNDVTTPGADCSQASHAGGVGIYNPGASLASADIAGTAWLAGTDPTLTQVSLFARPDAGITCTDDADCVALRGADFICDPVSTLCFDTGACDIADPGLAPCPLPTMCEDVLLGGGMACLQCTEDTDCRVSEKCFVPFSRCVDIGFLAPPTP